MPWLAPRWFPPFQEQAVVGDHRPVIRCFARTQLLALPFMLRQGFPRAFQRLERDGGYLDRLCWKGLPCWRVVPVYIGAVAALVGATEAPPHQEGAGGHVQAVRVDLPIR